MNAREIGRGKESVKGRETERGIGIEIGKGTGTETEMLMSDCTAAVLEEEVCRLFL